MMRPALHRICLGAALLLPLAILAYAWASTYRMAQQGQEWLIPIEGYDPRDLLRGHFVQYRYAWPIDRPAPDRRSDAAPEFDPAYASALCIEGVAPYISRVREAALSSGDADRPSTGCAIIVRATLGARREVRGLGSGIFFASQAKAIALSRKLADPGQQGLVRVRIRADGVMRPVDLEFRPRIAR